MSRFETGRNVARPFSFDATVEALEPNAGASIAAEAPTEGRR